MSLKSTVLSGPDKGTGEFRFVGGVLYIGTGEADEDGKHWVKFGKSGRQRRDHSRQGPRFDNPAHETGFLAAADDLKKAGAETCRRRPHRPTTRARPRSTRSAPPTRAGPTKIRQRTEKSLAQYEKLGLDELTMDLWVDAEDRTRQLRMQGFGRRGPLDLTITFSDFGKPVTVKAPPASHTVDLAEQLRKAAD